MGDERFELQLASKIQGNIPVNIPIWIRFSSPRADDLLVLDQIKQVQEIKKVPSNLKNRMDPGYSNDVINRSDLGHHSELPLGEMRF